ncbi:hypothetical protein PVV74_04010 [Roseovarius sp. SK2]|uniref:hypothetical protein n=1 Tax=Roseovarius TaxID=74030 RepID=UPI00237B1B13|nr:hypothetical protein [Roseovarius sp. SK2]MDD9724615.1 hypothetical protein [Roseovarius sp. SK2]
MTAGNKTMRYAAAMLVFAAPAAQADGEFFQLDLGEDTTTAVISVERDRLSYGMVFSDYTGPEDLNLTASFKFSLGTPVTFRAGPAIQLEGLETVKGGIRFVAEHYQPTSFGSVFLLGEATTIDRGYFALAAIGFDKPDVTFEFSYLGDDDGFRDKVAAVAFGIPNTKASFRAGYKLDSEESFIGISINTF